MSAIGLIKKIFQIELLNPEEFHWGGAGGGGQSEILLAPWEFEAKTQPGLCPVALSREAF